MIAEQLKKSILQAAIQGKLTEQLPEDGDARDLLKDIQKEKARLTKEGKIRKEKPLPEITEDEIPFDIPDSWCWVRLGNVGQWAAGTTPSRSNANYYVKGTIPWLKTGDLNDDIINEIPEFITELALKNTSLKLQPKGSVLIAMYGATIGKIGLLNIEATTNQACCSCVPYCGVYNWYVFYYLMSHKDNFIKQGAGGAQPNISKEKIVSDIIPIPPLDEQKRIVERLKEFLSEIDKLKSDETKLEELRKSFPKKMKDAILQYAIQGKLTEQLPDDGNARELLKEIQKEKARLIKEGKIKKEKPLPEITEDEIPFEIPENWCWTRIGDVFYLQAGKFTSSSSINSSGKYPCYGGNGLRGYVDSYNRFGLFPLIGRQGALCGNINIADGKFYATEHAVVVDLCSHCMPEWASYFLKALNLNQYSTATAQPGLAVSKINQVLIPVAPVAEQKRIVAFLEELLPLCEELK